MGRSSWFLSHPASGTLDVGHFGRPTALSSSVLSVIPEDGGKLAGEWFVVCMYPVRGLVRLVPDACGAQLLLTGLRAETFCEHEEGSDVSKTTPRPSVLILLCFVLGKSFFGKSHF